MVSLLTHHKSSHLIYYLIFFICHLAVSSTILIGKEIPIEIYSIDNGVAKNEVYSSFQDSYGHIWVGTNKGVSRFNGKTFTTFNSQNSQLGGDTIKSITEDTENRIWLAYNGGIAFLDDNYTFNNITPADGLFGNDVHSIWADLRGGIWAITEKGANYIFEEKIISYPIQGINLNYNSLVTGNANGDIFVALKNGLAVKKRGSEQFIPIPDIQESVHAVISEYSGFDVFYITSKALYKLDESFHIKKLASSPLKGSLLNLKLLSENQIWLCSDQAIWQWNSEQTDLVFDRRVLNNISISNLLIDQNSKLWLNSWNGFIKVKNFKVNTFRTINSETTHITSIQKSKTHYWIGTSQGIIQLNLKYEVVRRIPTRYVNDLKIQDNKTLIVATKFGLYFYTLDGKIIKTLGEEIGFNTIYQSKNGKVWFGGDKGVYSLNKNRLKLEINADSGLGSNTVWEFHEDLRKNIWIGTEKGVSILSNTSQWRHFNPKAQIPFTSVFNFAESEKWGVLLATNRGVYQFDQTRFLPLQFKSDEIDTPLLQQVNTGTIDLVRIDKNQNLWVGNRQGLFKINLNKEITYHLTQRSGLPTNAITKAGTFISNRDLLVGTFKGLALIQTDIMEPVTIPPTVHIENVLINGELHPLNKLYNPLKFSHHNITFQFDSIYLKSPEKVKYSYILENFDTQWSKPSKIPSATYTNLSFGKYTFLVKAIVNDNIQGDSQPVSFSIERPWWIRWWALLLEAISILFIFIIASKLITNLQLQKIREEKKKLDKENIELELTVRKRTNALEEEIHKKNQLSSQLEKKLREIQRDMDLARQLQQSVFPVIKDLSFLRMAHLFIPYNEVSGDMYDLNFNREGGVNFFIGDATGHGVSAAMMTMMLQITLDGLRQDMAPDKMMETINNVLSAQNTGMFITGILACFTPNGKLIFSNAGHPQLIIQRKKELIKFDKRGLPLGMFDNEISTYQSTEFDLQVGDRIYIYTDGILEWSNADGEQFGQERLAEYLLDHDQMKITDIVSHLHEHILRFTKKEQRSDDITFFAIEYDPLC